MGNISGVFVKECIYNMDFRTKFNLHQAVKATYQDPYLRLLSGGDL